MNLWDGTNRDRFIFISIIAAIWLLIKLLEELAPQGLLDKLPSNVSLALLGVVILILIVHAFYIFIAQFRRRRNPHRFFYRRKKSRPLWKILTKKNKKEDISYQEIAMEEDYKASIDIFISAHNEERVIEGTINELLDINYPDYKIYVINDRSTDATGDILKRLKTKIDEKHPKDFFTYINRADDAFPGKAAALNDALEISNSDLICVFDADARIEKDFFLKLVDELRDPFVAAVQVQKVISNPNKNLLTKLQFYEYAMDTYLQMGRDSIRGSVELRGNGQLIKRTALEDLGGWNENTLTDDLDLSTSFHVNGWDIRFSPEIKVYEEGVSSLLGLVKQRKRWAEGSMRRYLNYFLQLTKPGVLSLSQVFDTFAFVCQFSIPFWVSLDIVYEFIRYFNGAKTYITILMFVSISVNFVMSFAVFNGLRIYKKQKFFEALGNTLITQAYLLSIWLVVVFISYKQILIGKQMGRWIRTEHGV
jgi:1,2-diacylglycerol 3-beta-glucosyltransferase